MGPENFLKSLLTPFILNNILASMPRDDGNLTLTFPRAPPRVQNPNS